MKKLVIIAMMIALVGAVGCDDSSTPKGELTVQVVFSDTDPAFATYDSSQPGITQHPGYDAGVSTTEPNGLYVIAWKSTTDFTSTDPENPGNSAQTAAQYTEFSASEETDGTGSITFKLKEGDYKVMCLYNYKAHNSNLPGKGDYYALYVDNTTQTWTPASATDVTIAKDTPVSIKIDIDGTMRLDSNGNFSDPDAGK